MEKLTNKQIYILDLLKKMIAEDGYPPTVRELCQAANLSSTSTIHAYLTQLEKKGYIRKNDNKIRTLEILVPNEYLREDKKNAKVFIIGEIDEKLLFRKYEVLEEMFSFSKEFLNSNGSIFAIRVCASSFLENVVSGDILIFEEKEKYLDKDLLVSVDEEGQVSIVSKNSSLNILGSIIGNYHIY